MRHWHQMYMRFPHCTMDKIKLDKLAKAKKQTGQSIKGQKSNRQNEKKAKIRSPKQYEDKKLIGPCGRVRKRERTI